MGALNMHPSLLPRWRGAAPIERAILAGDSETGVTIMQMNEELDAGDIIRQQKISISPDATGGALSESLAETGAILMIKVLNNLAASSSYPQPAERVSYAAKISAAERVLDFNHRLICRRTSSRFCAVSGRPYLHKRRHCQGAPCR